MKIVKAQTKLVLSKYLLPNYLNLHYLLLFIYLLFSICLDLKQKKKIHNENLNKSIITYSLAVHST